MIGLGGTTIRDCEKRGADWTYDESGRSSLTNAVAEAIAEHRGVEPLDLDFSLYSSVDTEALDSLFASASDTELHTEFRVADVVVSIRKRTADEVEISVNEE